MKKLLGLFTSVLLVNTLMTTLVFAQETQGSSLINENSALDLELSELISRHKLTGSPKPATVIPDIKSPIAQLGMKLFYSKSLGGDKNTACVSCHHPMLGGGDNLSLSIGVAADKPNALGSKRQTVNLEHTHVPRNAPTTFNLAFWKKRLFHDGRIQFVGNNEITTPDMKFPKPDVLAGENLVHAQARFPITSQGEMRGKFMNDSLNQTLRRGLAKRLQKNWLQAFREGFEEPNGTAEDLITEQNFSAAIAAFEQSQVFINNPWKKYVEGDKTALSNDAKKGAKLFLSSQNNGGAGCANCHSGDFFTNENLYNVAMPQIGLGKNSGATGSNDYGRELATKSKNDRFKFRVPSLLNVEMTGPWSHSGAYTSLEAVTKHMLSPEKAIKNYDPKQLKQKNLKLTDLKTNTNEALTHGLHIQSKPDYTEEEVKYLVSFLKSLTDPCTKDRSCMSNWIPSPDMNDPDGMMLHAVDSITGKPL